MNAPDTGADVGHAASAGAGHDPPDQTWLRQLANEQAALRRVATLVAHGARSADVFTAVADELCHLIGAEASFVSRVLSSPAATGQGLQVSRPESTGSPKKPVSSRPLMAVPARKYLPLPVGTGVDQRDRAPDGPPGPGER